MAMEVRRQIKSDGESSNTITTRDFLGGSFAVESKELDLDLHVPAGWEKRLDLKSGKVYIQQCIQQSSSSEEMNKMPSFLSTPKPRATKTLNLFEDTALKLNTPSPISPSGSLGNYSNALDKVKLALDRTYRFPSPTPSYCKKKRSTPSVSPSLSHGSVGLERAVNQNLVAGACPNCLLYVLISETNLKCPKCNSRIPVTVISSKKLKIDLNMSI